jgi:hypothetical protein
VGEREGKKKGLLNEVGLITPLSLTPTLLKTWIQVDMYIDDQVICCWFVFARVFWLLCYVTLRQEHMYEHIEVPTVFFVLFILLPLITAKP